MNTKVNLGKDENNGDVNVDLSTDNLHFIILVGSTGSGKSVFHYNLYKQLVESNSPEELGFIIYDTTRVDFAGWKSPFLIDFIPDSDKALLHFENINSKIFDKFLVVHIEEMNMLQVSTKRFEKALDNLLQKNKNCVVVFSTSRPGKDVLTPKILSLVDMKLVFNLSSEVDSKFVLGDNSAVDLQEPGERFLVIKNKKKLLQPFSEQEYLEADRFFWPDLHGWRGLLFRLRHPF